MNNTIINSLDNIIYLNNNDINIINILEKHKKILYYFIIEYLDYNEKNEKNINDLYIDYQIYCTKNIIKPLNSQIYYSLILTLFKNDIKYNLSDEYIILNNIIYKKSYLLYSVD